MKLIINNLEEFNTFGEKLAKTLSEKDVISLDGDLGAGKTTLVQIVGRSLGVIDNITSPTFAIINIYNGDVDLYHLDLYRLEDPSELEVLDYETYFYPENAITFIEWASQGNGYLPEDLIVIRISKLNDEDEKREIEIIENCKRASEISNMLKEMK